MLLRIAASLTWHALACFVGDAACVDYLTGSETNRVLYEAEACINNGANAYHLAVLGGSAQCLELLLSACLSSDAALLSPWLLRMHPLHVAVAAGRVECVRTILRYSKASITHMDLTSAGPLMWGCYSGSAEACRLLIEAGASVVADDDQQNTPMHVS